MLHDAFHFPSLVWDWPIAIYLFLLGISAGATSLSVLLRRKGAGSESGIIKATAILAPVSVVLGLLILIFHLARPWTFWKLMFHYQFDSVMSMGVMLFQVYMAVLFAWLAVVFRAEIETLRSHLLQEKFAFVDGLIGWLARIERLLAPLLLLLAVLLGAYTGFLLSALKTYPLLNNTVLPVLFLISGVRGSALSTASSGRCWRWRCCCWSASLPASTSVAARRRQPCGPPSAAASGLRCSGSGWWASACCCPSCWPCWPRRRCGPKTAIWCWSAA